MRNAAISRSAVDVTTQSETLELDTLLKSAVEQHAHRLPVEGVVVGVLVALPADRTAPLVGFDGQPGHDAIRARTTVDLTVDNVGQRVALMFERGDRRWPIVVGCLRESRQESAPEPSTHVEVSSDGQRLLLTAKEQIVLRCGKASITLTSVGKVIVQGAYLSNRSSGVLRLKGSSVQLN
jgi:hypothetical protein